MTLIVTLQDGRQEAVPVPEGVEDRVYLEAFVNGRHPFTKPWVELTSGEYVHHTFIVSIRVGN